MAVKKHESKPKAEAPDVPQFFRLNIEVGDLESAISFYADLLAVKGRKQAGSRCYFDCGPVTLQVLDVSASHAPHPAAKALYFTVNDLEAAYERARALDRSTSRTRGTTRCALSRKAPFTRVSQIRIKPRRMPCVTASVRVPAFSLLKIEATWNFAVCSEIPSFQAMVLLP